MEFQLPELGEGVYEAEMTRWLVKPGDPVRPGQALLEVLTDKATMEVPAPFSGTIAKLRVHPGDKLTIGQSILAYEAAPGAPASTTTEPRLAPSAPPQARNDAPASASQVAPRPNTDASALANVRAAPAIRQLARKLGVDLTKVRGSGPHGRILIEDLAAAVKHVEPIARYPMDFGTGQRIKLHGLRRKIAEHMVLSKRTIPHFTYVDECDLTELVKHREQHKVSFSQQGAKLTFLAYFVKAAARALKEVPMVNASLDDVAGEIVLHDHINVGIAVATTAGLIVPVIHDADRLSLLDIAKTIERLGNEARAAKSQRDDLRGGTFTITSIGSLGGLFATPIINYPEVGILGVGQIVKRPVYDAQGQIRAADMVYLSLAFDHRVVDGAVAVEFGNAIMRHLRKPGEMLDND